VSTSLTDAAYETLRQGVLNCSLAPGERVTERQLVESTGFGKTPVREALARLAGDGLVEALPRRGYVVTPITLADVDEMFEALLTVGPAMFRAAMRKNPAQVHDSLTRAARDLAGDYAQAALRLFEGIATATGNSRLVELYRRLFHQLERVFALAYRKEGPADWLADALEGCATLVATGDVDGATDHYTRLNQQAYEDSVRLLSSLPSVRAVEISA
jgi:DNA-binding GntR family transcriptional regulator